MSGENESCGGMPRNELEIQFKAISESINDIKSLLGKINDRQQDHFNDLTEVKKDISYIKKEIEENKVDHKEEIKDNKEEYEKKISHIWNELRSRDKSLKKYISIFVTALLAVIGALIVSFFSKP